MPAGSSSASCSASAGPGSRGVRAHRRPGYRLKVPGPALLAWALVAAAAGPVTGQVPTQKRRCTLGADLDGVTGHALMRYTVDRQGHVNFVKPAFVVVEPGDREPDVVASLQECLKTWRYPPNVAGWSSPQIEVLQAFHWFPPAPPGAEVVPLADGRRIPRVHLEEMRALRVRLAKELLSGPRYAETHESGWTLLTDARRRDAAAVVDAIRFAGRAFDMAFPGRPPPTDEEPVTLFLFGSEDSFNQVAAFDHILRGPKPAGQYTPADATAYTFVSKQEQPLRLSIDVVVHEVVHHLVHERLAGGDRDLPYWAEEGIASYLELLRTPKDGSIDLADFERGRQAQGAFSWTAPATRYLDAVTGMQRTDSWPDFEAFLDGRFESLTAEESYGLSWLLVHYLLHGEEGALRAPFEAWLAGPAGSADDPGIAAALDREPERIRLALAAYADSLRH